MASDPFLENHGLGLQTLYPPVEDGYHSRVPLDKALFFNCFKAPHVIFGAVESHAEGMGSDLFAYVSASGVRGKEQFCTLHKSILFGSGPAGKPVGTGPQDT